MRILIVGTGGRLGAALLREYGDKFDAAGFDRSQLDLSDLDGVREKLGETNFDLLINAAGFTKVDLCETHPDRALLINVDAHGVLAEIFSEKSAKLIHFITVYVFNWEKSDLVPEIVVSASINVMGGASRASS